MSNPFRYFKTSPEIIRLAVMMYVRFPLSLRQVEDLLHERGIDICHETVRGWWNRFGPVFAAEIRKKRSAAVQGIAQWRWHLDEVFVRINGETHYLWRAVDLESEVLEAFVTKQRNRMAALRFLRNAVKRYGRPEVIVTDRFRSYVAAMTTIGNETRQVTGRWLNNRAENSHQRLVAARDQLGMSNAVSIAEIAYGFGISDQAQFSPLFRARFGITPSASRRSSRNLALNRRRGGLCLVCSSSSLQSR